MVSLDIDRILGFPAFGQLMLNVRQRGRVKGFQILNGRELSVLRLFIGSELEHDREVRPVRLDSQIESFEGYGVTQTAQLKKAYAQSEGIYVIYMAGDQADDWKSAFESAIK